MTDKLNEYIEIINNALDDYICTGECLQASVSEAMRYSVSAGGKRLRPVLALAFCEMLGGDIRRVLPAACAVEMIHAASLIHDDLPCMDDDDFRRGQPSCHKKFGEAIATLAGDALYLLGAEIIVNSTEDNNVPADMVIGMLKELTSLSGVGGMIGGQVIDIESEGKEIPVETLMVMHLLKTGALIRASCKIGCIAAGANAKQLEWADEYGSMLGLAFQARDDILDVIGDYDELGKTTGADEKSGKATFVTIYGMEKAKQLAAGFTASALESLDNFKNNEFITELTKKLADRKK